MAFVTNEPGSKTRIEVQTCEQALRESPALRERLAQTIEAARQATGKLVKRAAPIGDDDALKS